jgi:hypothetical protein
MKIPQHILEDASFRASVDDVLSQRPKDGPFLRMAVEGIALHPHQDGSGYQCNRNALLQDVYDTCRKILQGGYVGELPDPQFLNGESEDPIDRQMELVGQLADKEDVPFDLLWAVWVRMNEKTGTNL